MDTDRGPQKRYVQSGRRRGYSRNPSTKGAYKQQHSCNSNEDPEAISSAFRSLNVARSDNSQDSNERLGQSAYGNSAHRDRNFNHGSYGDPPDSSADKVPSQRGHILGGRYVRKQGIPGSSRDVNAAEQNSAVQRSSYPPPLYGSRGRYFGNKPQSNGRYNQNNSSRGSSYQPREYVRKKYDSPKESTAASYQSRECNNEERYNSPDRPVVSHDTSYQSSREYNNNKKYDSSNRPVVSRGTSCQSSREYNNDKKHDTSNDTSYSSRKCGKRHEDSGLFHQEDISAKKKSSPSKSRKEEENNATQRELLMSRLSKGECECLVCCEPIRTKDQTWHCLSCFHVFHLRCIKKWARSPAAAVKDGRWRCPACQNLSSQVPFDYRCFCGANRNPEINYHLTPHSCGEICDRAFTDCPHSCKELCHPGPCPPCAVVVRKTCPCGKTAQTLPCNQSMEGSCQSVCEKLLNCNFHKCKSKCHKGPCLLCEEIVEQKCYCGKSERSVACTEESASRSTYACGDPCGKTLGCGHHACTGLCHPGTCEPCCLAPGAMRTCCCGKSGVEQLVASGAVRERTSCQDPVPVCGRTCGKTLLCGPKENPHTCRSLCHEGECPACPLSTSVKCSCGAFTRDFPCDQMTRSFLYRCEKRCNRRKDCGRHKCLNHCCTSTEHRCELVCNKKLSCGLHLCRETCHMGNCPTCWNVSFDELRCYCGTSVSYPPIQCGTKPPECSQPCTRSHPCDHDVKHTCHSDEHCPPCTSLTTKWCYGKHKQCGPVMCFLEGVSCGMPCQKPLPCGRHTCRLTCHAGHCLKEAEKCTQPCTEPRPSCGHPCGIPCHEGPCIETPCKAQVTSNCPCGRRSETTTCFDSSKSYRLMSSTILATKMQEIKDGQSVNLNDVLGKKSKNSKLQCNEECAVIERNKRLALALQIQNPDLSCSPGPPSYSEFLKEEAKKNPHFVADVYDKLTTLVQLAMESKQKNRRYAFPSMNRDQRRVVHELAEFFGCETQSYDEEPKRNVVATAVKNKCWLPFTSIMAVVQRDMGIRKGPTPMVAQRDAKSSSSSSSASSTQKKKIDYFDYNE